MLYEGVMKQKDQYLYLDFIEEGHLKDAVITGECIVHGGWECSNNVEVS